MRKVITYLIRFPVWVTVLMASVMLFGLLAFSQEGGLVATHRDSPLAKQVSLLKE